MPPHYNTLIQLTIHRIILFILRGGGQPYSLNKNNIDLQNNPTINTTTSITQQTQNKENTQTKYAKDSQLSQNLDSKNSKIPTAEVFLDNFKGCADSCARSLLDINDKAQEASSLESAKKTMQKKDSLLFQPIDTLTQELFNTNSCPYLPKLYGIYKSVDEIDFSKLPQSFVLKTNHDCGGVVLVKDKVAFLKDSKSFSEAMDKLTKHLSTNYYHTSREWHYKDIEPRIFAEEMLGESVNGSIIDYKVHVVQNAISHIDVVTDRHTGQKEIAMDSKWHKMPFDYEKKATQIPQKPTMLDKMLDVSLLLAQAFKYVRVDLYCVEMNIYVGELTFTSASGKDKFTPQEWDRKLGDLWDINTSLSRVES